jgi:hypothetical protein
MQPGCFDTVSQDAQSYHASSGGAWKMQEFQMIAANTANLRTL